MPSLSNHQSRDFTIEDVVAHFNRPVLLNEHGCWIWQGSTDKYGYARYASSMVYAVVWRLSGRSIPVGHEFRHMCPNHACINPDHFCTGTHFENMQDAVGTGTMGVKGRVPLEKLATAREMLANGVMKKDVAEFLGVSPPWITKFINGGYKYAKPQ